MFTFSDILNEIWSESLFFTVERDFSLTRCGDYSYSASAFEIDHFTFLEFVGWCKCIVDIEECAVFDADTFFPTAFVAVEFDTVFAWFKILDGDWSWAFILTVDGNCSGVLGFDLNTGAILFDESATGKEGGDC